MRQAEKAGLEGFLIKPVNPSVMFNTILEVFGQEVARGPRNQDDQRQIEDALQKIAGAHILLVEDNEINQQVAMEILTNAGLQVTLAINGAEAVNMVRENHFDAVLMDIQMPVLDGYAATRRIRKWEKELKAHGSKLKEKDSDDLSAFSFQPSAGAQLPIIAMTAHAMTGDREKSLAVGMNDHVAKPIDPIELFSTLQQWISADRDRKPPRMSPSVSSAGAQESTAGQKKPPAQSDTPEDELPHDLPGFDVAAGLKRLQGNRKLYRKLLVDFIDNYGSTAQEIEQALSAEDIHQVHSLVHNIKGLAGNLSAVRLQSTATQMDGMVKQALAGKISEPDQMHQSLKDLKNALEEALTSCLSLKHSAVEVLSEPGPASIPSMPLELAQQTAERLRNAADMGNITELKAIAEALRSDSNAYGNFSDAVERMAEDFDLDGIQRLADELETAANASE